MIILLTVPNLPSGAIIGLTKKNSITNKRKHYYALFLQLIKSADFPVWHATKRHFPNIDKPSWSYLAAQKENFKCKTTQVKGKGKKGEDKGEREIGSTFPSTFSLHLKRTLHIYSINLRYFTNSLVSFFFFHQGPGGNAAGTENQTGVPPHFGISYAMGKLRVSCRKFYQSLKCRVR